VVRVRLKRPAEATSGSKLLDGLAKVVHYGLYATLLATTIIGFISALRSGRVQSIFFGAQPPPGGFDALGPLHGLTANLLLLLVALHVLAAIYHQFILKDNLIPRMWYGKR